ncbi:MAG: hypothetical protein IH623_23295 [Verrucomicrobia bacterium]|nr:hypothetical protein [Verrucomicrobiota bacterium]
MAFQSGISGNPSGRPRGVPDRRSKLRRQLEADAPTLIRKAVELAKGGDVAALRICLDRVLPPLRAVDSPQTIEATGNTPSELATAIVREAIAGNIAPDVAKELTAALAGVVRIKEADEFEQRLAALELRLKPHED